MSKTKITITHTTDAKKAAKKLGNPFKEFQVFNVLDDGETFAGVDGSTIQVFPNDEHCTEEQMDDLENGRIPETGDIETIDLKTLLTEALAAGLPCVADLAKRLEK